jgi:hypothetical protein
MPPPERCQRGGRSIRSRALLGVEGSDAPKFLHHWRFPVTEYNRKLVWWCTISARGSRRSQCAWKSVAQLSLLRAEGAALSRCFFIKASHQKCFFFSGLLSVRVRR